MDFEKVHEVRALLEVHIAGAAAERATEEDLARLRAVHERMHHEVGDVEAAARDDLEFHRVIAAATQNDLYLLLMDSIGTALIDIRRENLGSGSTPLTLGQHEEILERITARDPAGAHRDGRAPGGCRGVVAEPREGGVRGGRRRVTHLRRLDHVAVLVRSTDEALEFYAVGWDCASTRRRSSSSRTCGSPTSTRATCSCSSSSRSTATRR